MGDRGGPLGCPLAAQSEAPKALLWGPWGESRCKAVRSVCAQSTLTIRRDLGCWPGARFWLPWARSRAKRKVAFSKAESTRRHTGALCSGPGAFQVCFLSISCCRKREAQIQTFLKHPGALKGAIRLIFIPPCFCSVGSRGPSPGVWLEVPHPSSPTPTAAAQKRPETLMEFAFSPWVCFCFLLLCGDQTLGHAHAKHTMATELHPQPRLCLVWFEVTFL